MIRKSILISLCLVLLISVTPLFAGGQKSDSSDGKVTVDYWRPLQGPQDWMVQEFESRNPNVTIKQVDTPADEMRELITAAVSSGTGPDLFYFELGLGQVQPLLDANLVIDMEAPAERFGWRERLTDFALAEATHGGTLWAVPNEVEFIGTWYNKRIFQEIGVEVPTTWDELTAVAQKAEQAGYRPFAFGNSEKWPGLHRIGLAYQWNPDGREAVAEAMFEGGSFDTRGFVEGLQDLMQLDGQYWPKAAQTSYDEAASAFVEGKAAMFHMGTWAIENVRNSDNPGDFGVFVGPEPGTPTPSTVAGAGGGWYINSNADEGQREGSLQFLDFAISEESMKEWAKDGYVPPVQMDLSGVEGVPPITQAIVETMNESMDQMGYFIHHFVSAEMSNWIQDGYQGMLLGEVTPQEFAARMQELAEEARAEGFQP